jgi:putative addiction module antidote
MNKSLKLIAIGNSTGVILPKELLQELGVDQGDSLFPVQTPNGVELRPEDTDFEEEMKILRDVMRRRRSALRELAK